MKEQLVIKFLHDCLLVGDILVIGDIHIGYDEQFHGRAVFPGMQLKEIIGKLEGVFEFLKKEKIIVKKIILLGDVKHDFGQITDTEWRETLQLLDYLKEKTGEKGKIIVVKGNHDMKLNPILRKKELALMDYYKVKKKGKSICFFHGNKLFKQCLDSQTDILVFGHLHPAITLCNNYKSEKYKCFLKGTWKRKGVYILPCFSSFIVGYNLNLLEEEKYFFDIVDRISNKILMDFNVIIYNPKENKEYDFGKLRKLI